VTDQNPFKTVMRGYDPAEVDRRLEELAATVTELTHQRDGLASRVEELHRATTASPEPATYEHLGSRVGQILGLADTEAAELRTQAQEEVDAQRMSAQQEATRVRAEADRYAARVQSEADAQAARIVEDARKAADEHRDSAERDASVRLQEAEAVYEEQRARAAKAAADFETTLAGRRSAAEDEFTQKMGEAQGRLDEVGELAERTRLDAESTRAQATKEAGRLVEDAREAAAQIVSEAKATAERIRTDSERELAAATQRRDSINSQLANVRQMLATLTGTAPFSLTGLADAPDEAWIGSDTEAPGAAEAAEVVEAQAAGHPDEVAADHAQTEDAPQESLAHDRG
jgi:DivIVA domain-containing protein